MSFAGLNARVSGEVAFQKIKSLKPDARVLFSSGFTVVLANRFFGTKGVIQFPSVPELPVLAVPPGLQRIPIVGDVLFGHNIIVYVTGLIVLGAIAVFSITGATLLFRSRVA
jgi:ABC-type uncharacterized transport system permease subunit